MALALGEIRDWISSSLSRRGGLPQWSPVSCCINFTSTLYDVTQDSAILTLDSLFTFRVSREEDLAALLNQVLLATHSIVS